MGQYTPPSAKSFPAPSPFGASDSNVVAKAAPAPVLNAPQFLSMSSMQAAPAPVPNTANTPQTQQDLYSKLFGSDSLITKMFKP